MTGAPRREDPITIAHEAAVMLLGDEGGRLESVALERVEKLLDVAMALGDLVDTDPATVPTRENVADLVRELRDHAWFIARGAPMLARALRQLAAERARCSAARAA